jgi:hypothetical protein
MPGPATRITLMPLLQAWDGATLTASLLMLPLGSPLTPLASGDPTSPSFAAADLVIDVVLTQGLADMPPAGTQTTTVAPSPAPAGATALYGELAAQFNIDPAPPAAQPRRSGTQIKKLLPATYLAASGVTTPASPYAVLDDSYSCAINQPGMSRPLPNRAAPVPWGKVIAAAVRQPVLAGALGLIRALAIPVPAGLLSAGGWLHVTLDPGGDAGLGAVPGSVSVYAARIPPLTAARPVFTPVAFPVPPSGTASYDAPTAEAVDYADGFAKIVHAAQQVASSSLTETYDGTRPTQETGIRLGWEDEQVVIWLNRQIDPTAADQDTPMTVRGYRVDARPAGDPDWHSLCQASGPVTVGATNVGDFNGELAVETHPVQLDANPTGDFWLAPYYTRWIGGTLIGGDPIGLQLDGQPPGPAAGVQPVDPGVPLTYGTSYQFRGRLADHASGGPGVTGQPAVPGPAPTATIGFRRFVRPGKPTATQPASPDATSAVVQRPLLGWPAYACTGVPDAVNALLADLPAARAAGRQVGLPDPDVAAVQVTVMARSPGQDPATDNGWLPLYTASRPFPADPAASLPLTLAWQDVADATGLTPGTSGPLPLPTSRDLRLEIRSQGRDDPGLAYFGGADVLLSDQAAVVQLRKAATDETNLAGQLEPSQQLQANYLQPSPPPDPTLTYAVQAAGSAATTGDVIQRLATAARLAANGNTLRSQPGRRLVIGAAAGIRGTLGPDHASLTVASQNELTRQWIVCLRLTLDRDWTWDGLAADGLTVIRGGTPVGQLQPGAAVAAEALASPGPDRTQTDLLFLDAFDGKAPPGQFPQPATLDYEVHANWQTAPTSYPDPVASVSVEVPITTPPVQVPQLVSAGIALSAYVRSPDYSTTQPRQRMLWLQFDRPPDDPEDAYFARVLRYVPDPLLASGNDTDVPDQPVEPPLPVDPEVIRVITPGQSDDRAGIAAMQELISGDSPAHYLLPLPPGLETDSPELFGMFTYEFRTGHAGKWSTAQGRFGNPLRVAGLQHPAPALTCAVRRLTTGIIASAPWADAVLDGVSIRPNPPYSRLWILLYAQVFRADNADKRNVLLGALQATAKRVHTRSTPPDKWGSATWTSYEVDALLAGIGMPPDAPLSCLAVEVLPGDPPADQPLGAELGTERILRTSPLVSVPAVC